MGTPAQALKHRGDNKLYRIQVGRNIIGLCWHAYMLATNQSNDIFIVLLSTIDSNTFSTLPFLFTLNSLSFESVVFLTGRGSSSIWNYQVQTKLIDESENTCVLLRALVIVLLDNAEKADKSHPYTSQALLKISVYPNVLQAILVAIQKLLPKRNCFQVLLLILFSSDTAKPSGKTRCSWRVGHR